jgi:hypothetical protein
MDAGHGLYEPAFSVHCDWRGYSERMQSRHSTQLKRSAICRWTKPRAEHRAMKSFASPSLFRVVDLLLAKSNPHLKLSRWSHEDID